MKRQIFAILLIILGLAFSAQAEEGLEPEEALEYDAIYGEVTALDRERSEIRVIEYDYEEREDRDVVYRVKEETEYEGVEGLDDIKPGNWVDLEFHVDKEGKRIADFIALEIEPVFEEE